MSAYNNVYVTLVAGWEERFCTTHTLVVELPFWGLNDLNTNAPGLASLSEKSPINQILSKESNAWNDQLKYGEVFRVTMTEKMC